MGITFNDARMLWHAHVNGTDFTNTLTIGHQSLAIHPAEVKWFQQAFFKQYSACTDAPLCNYTFHDYADEFLKTFLCAQQLSILDYSPYENASIIHDMNSPIPDQYHNTFDAVIDGGSLEHIFNTPVALNNLTSVVKPGGSIFITVPSNNLCGHGLYQFSPELFFRYFSSENGFHIREISLFESRFSSIELSKNKTVYHVSDPKTVCGRVGYSNKKPTTIMVHAVKLNVNAGTAIVPLQNDYSQMWIGSLPAKHNTHYKETIQNIFKKLPHALKCLLSGYKEQQRLSLHNKKHFHKTNSH